MAHYSTSCGRQVFSAGAFTLAGSIRQKPVAQLLENIWAQIGNGQDEVAPLSKSRS